MQSGSKIYKKIIFYVIAAFFIINLLLAFGQFSTKVSGAAPEVFEARLYWVPAHLLNTYEVILINLGVDYENPVLIPMREVERYFYHKGREKLPEGDSERAVWFEVFEYYPIYLDYYRMKEAKDCQMLPTYGKELTTWLMENLYQNFELLSRVDFAAGENDYIVKRAIRSYRLMLKDYITNAHLTPGIYNLIEPEDIEKLAQKKELIQKLEKVHTFEKEFMNRYSKKYPQLLEHESKTADFDPNGGNFHLYTLNSLILFNRIKTGTFDCQKDQEYIEDYMYQRDIEERRLDESNDLLEKKRISYVLRKTFLVYKNISLCDDLTLK